MKDSSRLDTLGAETCEGIGEASLFPIIDDLSRRIKTKLEPSESQIKSDVDRRIGLITTSSPDAYRYYVEGREFLKVRQYPLVIESLEKAMALDPEFAEAYRTVSFQSGKSPSIPTWTKPGP